MMPKSTVGELAQEPGHDFPVVIANMPASAAERRVAFALIVLLFIVFRDGGAVRSRAPASR